MSTVSVVIPTYNRAKHLPDAIDSVFAQTYKNFEILIIDDGSIDNTKEIVEKYKKIYPDKIKYYCQENKGAPAARNKGIKESKGEYIAFLDSDDMWLPNKLEVYLEYFKKHDVELIGCLMLTADEKGSTKHGVIKPKMFPGDDVTTLLLRGSVGTPTLMARKTIRAEKIFFDESLKGHQDWDFCLTVAEKYKTMVIPETLTICKRHNQHLCSNKIDHYKNLIVFWTKARKNFNELMGDRFFRNKLAKYYYLLGREYYNNNSFRKSLASIKQSLHNCILPGKVFWLKEENIFSRMLKILKPYALLLAASLQTIKER